MEKPISRRHFLLLSSLLTVSFPYRHAFAAAALQKDTDSKTLYSDTIEVLREAYISEMAANKHYIGFCQKALDEKYPNIAYIFLAFSKSEKIHADNYERILGSLESRPDAPLIRLLILDTRANLRNAAEKELIKIDETYPRFLERLEPQMHEETFINCMYAWKSHRQHEEKIKEIQKYSKYFFSSVAEELEEMEMDLHVCGICGATIDVEPEIACEICNYPINHYLKIERPFRTSSIKGKM